MRNEPRELSVKPKASPIPPEQAITIRQHLLQLLSSAPLSAREISVAVHIPEKEVYAHLDHLRHSLHGEGRKLLVIPASCRKCGFIFSKRQRLKKPGRCPVCQRGPIDEPLFGIE